MGERTLVISAEEAPWPDCEGAARTLFAARPAGLSYEVRAKGRHIFVRQGPFRAEVSPRVILDGRAKWFWSWCERLRTGSEGSVEKSDER